MLKIVVLSALIASTAHAAPVPPDHACMGPWVGQAPNPDNTMFGITLTMTASPDGGRCGSIEYTNPACGGTLERCALVGNDIQTQEVYTHGMADCAPPGRVIIRCEGDTMRYQWLGQYSAAATLRRPPGWRAMPPPPPPPRIVPPAPPPPPPQDDDEPSSVLGCRASPSHGSTFWPLVLLAWITRRIRRAPCRALPARAPSAS